MQPEHGRKEEKRPRHSYTQLDAQGKEKAVRAAVAAGHKRAPLQSLKANGGPESGKEKQILDRGYSAQPMRL